ncbi:unnamed protein product (macronuclear) [Paramecium tetraurelia]|uniref:RAP domain-containing protein n=1 Tax=Paramecium tetraurelia TaxID=5888 RepID=A0D292_PARTE|nr:uncharacterized protein GSPATT00012665001 [Paramecium tetraurelia]CAK77159.1 unnamed protein product [Paramecium tetraurelia]|eukprot:XP_001444556.1 hypothetical protein (macronuclear) [Paramecium tetraurelia strain d4-2]
MLKFLFTSKLPLRLFKRSIACFSQQSAYKEQEYLSDGEIDYESKTLLSKFEVYQHFVNAQTTEEVIKAFKDNNLSYEQVHFAAFQLMNIVTDKHYLHDSQLDAFVQETIIPNFEKLNSEQCVTVIQLFLKLQTKSYSIKIKRHIDQNLKNYTYLQLPYVFSFYSKQGWKMAHIGKILTQCLPTQAFTAHSLCQIIRGCYIEYSTFKSTQHSDLAYLACHQLINLIDNINFHGLVAVFNQLARMHFDQTSFYKRLPEVIYILKEKFIENFDKISQYSKLKLLEAYSELPESFPNELFLKLLQSFESDNLTNANQLKLYVLLKIQKQKNKPSTEVLQMLISKINFENIIETAFLIKFLDVEFEDQYQNIISLCIKTLKRNYNSLSIKQKADCIKVIIKQNRLNEIFELNQLNDTLLFKIIESMHYCHKYIENCRFNQQKKNIKECVKSFFKQVGNQDYELQLKIASLILTLDPYQDDPFYEFINKHIKLESLPDSYFYIFFMRLNSKYHFNQEVRTRTEQLLPTFDQLQKIINEITNIDFANDKLVKQIAKSFITLTERNCVVKSFNINVSLNLLFTLIINCPYHSLHNMRGTVLQSIRELIELFTKLANYTQQKIEINIELLIKFHQLLQQLELRTNIISNICQQLCKQIGSLSDLEKLQVATIITEINVNQFQITPTMSNFLNSAIAVKMDTYYAILIKTKLLFFQIKNQARLQQKQDEVQLNLMIDQLKQEIIKLDLTKQQEHYIDGLMILMEYDGWRFNNLKYEEDGLKDFIELQFNNIDHLLTMNNMRPGLKAILKTIGQFDSKYQFIRNYENVFKKMLLKCHNIRNHEIPSIPICLEYIEFSKKIKLNNDDTIQILTEFIKRQIDNVKQIQIVEILQNLSEQRVYVESLFDGLSKQISRKVQFYSGFELIDILNSYAKIGYFNESLILTILDKIQIEQRLSVNPMAYVQTLWSVLISLQYLKKQQKKNYFVKYEKLIVNLMNEVSKFPNLPTNTKMPVIFRQFMDIYNLLEFSMHLDLQLNQKQQQLAKQIIENGKKIVNTKLIPNQKLNQSIKSLMQYLDKSQIEYKVNYYFDNQYVDFYIQMRNHIISIDNSLYVTYDMKHYTGFHYFNKWILEGASKKYDLKEIRINANEWNQMNDDERRKILLM